MRKKSTISEPIDVMAAAPWNVLDATGKRIALCGFDNDHERSGPAIARALVDAMAENAALWAFVRGLADASNWHGEVGCLQWIGKANLRACACDMLDIPYDMSEFRSFPVSTESKEG